MTFFRIRAIGRGSTWISEMVLFRYTQLFLFPFPALAQFLPVNSL